MRKMIIKTGIVEIKNSFIVREFDEDDGWIKYEIQPGKYVFRVLKFFSCYPRQILTNHGWLDVATVCLEMEVELENE